MKMGRLKAGAAVALFLMMLGHVPAFSVRVLIMIAAVVVVCIQLLRL